MSLLEQLSRVVTEQLAPQSDAPSDAAPGGMDAMVPVVLAALAGGLRRNASQPEGAEALSNALDRHDGSLLNDAARLRDDDVVADGRNILGHIFGDRQGRTERALARAAGVDEAQIGDLMARAAPALLAALGRARREQGLDAGALAELVTQESSTAQQNAPNELNGLMRFLDEDGDGDFQDDLIERGGALLSGFFRRS